MSSGIGSLFSSLFLYLRSLLFSKHLEICVVGLQAAGKTSLVNLLSSGQFADEMVPTVGFNMRKVRSGNTTIKVWDIGGQPRFRSMWERYCRGVSAIVFVVDSSVPLPSAKNESTGTSTSKTSAPTSTTSAPAAAPAASTAASKSEATPVPAPAIPSAITSTSGQSTQSSSAWSVATEELHALIERPHLSGVPLLILATKNDIKGAARVDDVIRVMKLDTIANREVSCYSISSKNQVNIDVTLKWLVARSPVGQR
ncbi:potential ADP-ribosylation factor [Pseudozyma hubeiensis SY62]|uniref:Potential ADP-ribosylation factor n=1 Tax=Pseudozyma hubeiensis (strain SY62) TaxID=1305764 RepID=R9PEC3_PSEHS|nr:potential ADP-ribosylation factor [Pseudozyma hubeiensis SY62]GAC96435.1 potential ADP-ribosylation factor [Pseudozyma hubeiensis SY62]